MARKSRKRQRIKNSSNSNGAKKQKLEANEETCKEKLSCKAKIRFNEMMKKSLKMEMPDDFYEFLEFCKGIKPLSENGALSESLGLELCGPYDIISGKLLGNIEDQDAHESEEKHYLKGHLHSRFYFDPPELMTVLRESEYKLGFHIGYFRDNPTELPSLVVSNNSEEGCVFNPCGDNIFAAVSNYCGELLKNTKDKAKKEMVKDINDKLDKAAKELGHSLELVTKTTQKRNKKVVTKTFHKVGLVVPLDDNDVGYRPLNLTNNALKKLLTKICEAKIESEKNKNLDELHELITLVQFANDECDYGMGLELGIDLFCNGNDIFKGQILQLMPLAYSLLGKEVYGEIIEKHLEKRERRFIDMTVDETETETASKDR